MTENRRKIWYALATGSVLLLIGGLIWAAMVVTYESDLGTTNVVLVDYSNVSTDPESDNILAELSFDSGSENLTWSSIEIDVSIDGDLFACSFGSQSNSSYESGKISANLGADGQSFTTIIDATDDEEFTYLDVAQQTETNVSNYWMKFSTTDVFLSEGVQWTFLEGVEFDQVDGANGFQLSNNTDDRLEWYEYDMAVHRVIPNDGVYVISKGDSLFKAKFLTYYDSDDNSRYPTLLISALNGTYFPAIDNPDLVVPSSCKILTSDMDEKYWNSNETIRLMENNVDLCSSDCDIKVNVRFETIDVEIKNQ